MKYYLLECSRNNGGSMTAGVKARADVEQILETVGYQKLVLLQAQTPFEGTFNKIKASRETATQWNDLIKDLKPGDELVVQMPLSEHTLSFSSTVKKLRRKGVKTVAVIHDLEKLRMSKLHNTIRAWKGQLRVYLEETAALKRFDRIIVHNPAMIAHMQELGYPAEKLVSLEIFDYLIPEQQQVERLGSPDSVIIAGNLVKRKAGYAYQLPKDHRVSFSLYGVGYEGETADNVSYFGSFRPEVLPYAMNGKYGLVWDGPTANTCGGVYGEYLRINNPHKTSLYLASGFPVIIWSQAALAGFVQENGVGICVDSLAQIPEAVAAVTEEAYSQMRENAASLSGKLRAGEFLKAALEKCSL